MKPRTFDYVIVGAGSAGCTLANRLTEDRDVSVLVLEAGGWDRDMWIHLPLGWGRLLQERRQLSCKIAIFARERKSDIELIARGCCHCPHLF